MIIAIVEKLDIFEILIDGGNSCDIMYSYLFEKMCMGRGSLWLYKGSYLQAFNEITTRPQGYAERMISVSDGKGVLIVNS